MEESRKCTGFLKFWVKISTTLTTNLLNFSRNVFLPTAIQCRMHRISLDPHTVRFATIARPQKIEFFFRRSAMLAAACRPALVPMEADDGRRRRRPGDHGGGAVVMSRALALPIPVGVLVATTAVMPMTRGRPSVLRQAAC